MCKWLLHLSQGKKEKDKKCAWDALLAKEHSIVDSPTLIEYSPNTMCISNYKNEGTIPRWTIFIGEHIELWNVSCGGLNIQYVFLIHNEATDRGGDYYKFWQKDTIMASN